MDENTKRQVVMITGAGRGIGAAIARQYIDDGFDVVLNYRRGQGKAAAYVEHLVELAARHGVRAVKVRADISAPNEVTAMMRELEHAGVGQIDHLILNAAASTFKRFSEMTKSDWKLLVGTSLIGNVCCVNAVSPKMPPGGTICALSSLGSRMVLDRYPLGVMKAALEHLVRCLAVELREQRIRVNGVCAGLTNTDTAATLLELWPDMVDDDKSLLKMLEPEQVASVVCFLSSPMASAINGEIVVADAGFSVGATAPLEASAAG